MANMKLLGMRMVAAIACVFAAQTMVVASGARTKPVKPILVLREGLDGGINEWSGPAKFVLYDNGTVLTDSSDETSPKGGTLRYYESRLTPAQAARLLKELEVKRIMGNSQHQYGQGEGVTWQLLCWQTPGKAARVTVIDDLSQAPAGIAGLIRHLEQFSHAGKLFLDYDYQVTFSNASDQMPAFPWPQAWRTPKLSPAVLAGVRPPDVVYEAWLEAPRALWLQSMLSKTHTHCISVNGHVWGVRLSPAPRLPSDTLWVERPIGPAR